MFKSNVIALFLLIVSLFCFVLYLLNNLFNFQPLFLLSIMLISLLGTILIQNPNDNTYKKKMLLFSLFLYLAIILAIISFKIIAK